MLKNFAKHSRLGFESCADSKIYTIEESREEFRNLDKFIKFSRHGSVHLKNFVRNNSFHRSNRNMKINRGSKIRF